MRYYGEWMREEAFKRIGHLYPKARLQDGSEATVIAWLWARTVRCPNPACGARMPLVRSFALSTKKGKETWVEPIVDREAKTVRFEVRTGTGKPPEGTKQRGRSTCLICGGSIADGVLREQARQYGMGEQLMAVVAEGARGRTYVAPAGQPEPEIERPETPWLDQPMPENPRWFSPPGYGLPDFADLFTPRQLVALTTFSDLVGEARERVLRDVVEADRQVPKGRNAAGYADAAAAYLAMVISSLADRMSSLCTWDAGGPTWGTKTRNTFARQALPMSWDFAEVNPFSTQSGSLGNSLDYTAKGIGCAGETAGVALQASAATQAPAELCIVSTDPPYYDNIGYADLSDFFYVWLRRSLQQIYPSLFSTMLVPKAQELVAAPYRFEGNKRKAEAFFRSGLEDAFTRLREDEDQRFPMTVYYAFKQAETDNGDEGVSSTGWETMLEGLLRSGFGITGTWPMRSELANRMIASGTNALASSIVLVCRPRPNTASLATRGEFLRALKRELPGAIRKMQQGNIAPVDLAQASIGPGMAVFSRYAKVLEASGDAMSVRTALGIINTVLDEVLQEQESEYDADTRWAVAWFEQLGTAEGPYGDALTLSTAKDTSIEAMREAGIVQARGGKVRLLGREELERSFDPRTDTRLTVWELTQRLVHAISEGSESEAAELLARAGTLGEVASDLAYRLFLVADRKGWTAEALAYNGLVTAWSEITKLSGQAPSPGQAALFGEG